MGTFTPKTRHIQLGGPFSSKMGRELGTLFGPRGAGLWEARLQEMRGEMVGWPGP